MTKLYAALLSMLFVCGMLAGGDSGLDIWISGHLNENEKVLCQSEKGYDYFFVSRSGDKLKTGHRINLSSTDGKPKGLILRWGFKNAKGNYVGLSGEPKIVSQKILQDGELTFIEEVAYYDIFLDALEVVDVAVGIKKYTSGSEVPSMNEFEDSELDEIIICKNVYINVRG